MNRVFVILAVVILLLLACGKQQKPVAERPLPFTFDENLLQIDSLLQYDADSALMVLLSMDKACLVPMGYDDVSRTANACVGALLLS